jgi:curli biogenesis system outer membrane secretion channel CsgG
MRKALLGMALVLSVALPAVAQDKHRVAVLDFGYGTVMTSVQAIFGSNQDVGKGISDLLINELVNDGRFRVIERSAIDKILKEQNFSNSDRANSATAAKIGGLLGVDTIIIGDVTQFGRDDKHYGGGGGGGSIWTGGGGGLGINKSKAVVEVTARMVDVNTGEILASVTGHGESQRNGLTSSGSGFSGWKGGGGQLDMGSTNFSQSILGQAVKQAVGDTAKGLDSHAAGLPVNAPPPAAPIDGLVADASGGDIIINVGSSAGVHVGDKLAVTRVVRTVKDPVTGKVLRTIDSPVGMLTITSVDSGSAVGKFDGAGAPKVGDAVKRPQ